MIGGQQAEHRAAEAAARRRWRQCRQVGRRNVLAGPRDAAALLDMIERPVVIELLDRVRAARLNRSRQTPLGWAIGDRGGSRGPVFGVGLNNCLIQCAHCVVHVQFERADTGWAGPRWEAPRLVTVAGIAAAVVAVDTGRPAPEIGCDSSERRSAPLVARSRMRAPAVGLLGESFQPAGARWSADSRSEWPT